MCWHKWTRWVQYTAKTPTVYEQKQAFLHTWRQSRSCVKCNYWQDEEIRTGDQPDFSKVVNGRGSADDIQD